VSDDDTTFEDWPDDGDGPDDSAAVDDYMAEVAEAAEAFGVPVEEPGEAEPGPRP
jgi:hypothetical protein